MISSYGENHGIVAGIYGNLGEGTNNLRKREQLYLKALNISLNQWGENNHFIALNYALLSKLYGKSGNIKKEKNYGEKSAKILRNFLSEA